MVKALACELPTQREQPLSRYSTADLTRLIAAHPDAPPMSASTIWRLLDSDALKPWQHQSWLYPRDPQFAVKAGRVLDLYAGWWAGAPLGPADCLISADEQILSVEFKLNLLRPARSEQLQCRATVLRAGRTISVVEAEVHAGDSPREMLVSKATVTLATVPNAQVRR